MTGNREGTGRRWTGPQAMIQSDPLEARRKERKKFQEEAP